VPIVRETAVLPGRLAAAVEQADWRTASLHALLADAGVVPHAGRATLTAECATATDARLLMVRRNAALLVERRLIVDAAGRPVELTESRYAASRYGLAVRFSVEPPRPAR
jgi:GntR family transcriptional regulator